MTTQGLTDALRETLSAFDSRGEPLSTSEVATRLDLGRRSTYERLERLADRDLVQTKKVGASARVWWREQDVVGRSPTPDTDRNSQANSHGMSMQFDRFVDAVSEYAIFVLDPDGHVESWNDGAERIKGYEADDIVGTHFETFYTDEDVANDVPERNLQAAMRLGSIEDEGWRRRADGSRFWANVTITAIRDDGGRLSGFTKVTRDMTDRRAYERRLEDHAALVERQRDELERELDAVFDRLSDGIYGLDDDNRLTYVNDHAKTILDVDDDAIGGPLDAVTETSHQFESAIERARCTQEPVVDEERQDATGNWYEYTIYPSESGLSVYTRDVTARKERERRLRKRVAQQDVLATIGQRALETRDVDDLLADATALVADTLDTEYSKVLDLQAGDEELEVRQGVGWDDGIVGEAAVSATEDDSQAAYTLRTDEPVVVENLSKETRFGGPDLLTDHDVASGISVVIGPTSDPWGIFGVHDTEMRSIDRTDANFVQAVAAILASAIDRDERERELVDQRERLEAVNGLNEVVRDLTDAVIDQSTRQEIEQTVVERLAAAESYEFAWVGTADLDSKTVSMRAEAGVEGYLDNNTISIDPADERSQGPTGRAFRTGEIQVTRNARADDRYDPWRDTAKAYDFQASAAIPIVHEDTVYGVLNVYTGRENAFTAEERGVIAQLGEVIGHSIAATERKQALVSDEVVEIEFHLPDAFGQVDADIEMGGSARIDHVTQISEETFQVYGSATPCVVDGLERLTDATDVWSDLTIREVGDSIRFSARLTEPTILTLIASRGGYVDEAVLEDDDVFLTVQLSPHTDIRAFVDAMTDGYPQIDLLSRTQFSRETPFAGDGEQPLDTLTDQQRSSVEAAYFRGFFEWPRLASGEDVADSLDIAPSTFHQHLRKAESKLIEAALTGPQ
ncbi:PAS domain S-box [Halovivax ruber XH-70]|uniref:PAS domain S-box n=1 Tax=Halovivax ruber (strain DSM 18193 / JCM 13892 / XH-70) TaxID=797302 RepID=L0IE86_HALRX|nr:bacterio-opsin activator domain-containing protein [Halovivax ruber]AGB16272.1 PAS domain S-box [Halovivax ruber XH-70]